jgi:hypothetical protein
MSSADNTPSMNGIGVGLVVAAGCLIGLRIVAPEMQPGEVFATLFFYGGMTGLLFELYRFVLKPRQPQDRR